MTKMFKLMLVSCLASTMLTTAVQAKDKTETVEVGFVIGYNDSFVIDGQRGSSVDFDSDYSYGFNFAYNFTNQFAIEFDWLFGSQDYQSSLVDDDGEVVEQINHKADITHAQIHGTYYFSPEDFSFYVQGGAGFSYMDSNIVSGPPINICWWDPWWGYICEGFSDTYSENQFSYSATFGARYNIDNKYYLRASYSQVWFDLDNASTTDVGVYKLEIGSSF